MPLLTHRFSCIRCSCRRCRSCSDVAPTVAAAAEAPPPPSLAAASAAAHTDGVGHLMRADGSGRGQTWPLPRAIVTVVV
jgi:hypothetical protein